MALEEGVFSYLSTYPGLVPLVGTRIYPLLLPQNPTLPAVTYQRISTPREAAFGRAFFEHPRFQFNCWADDLPAAVAVGDQVKAALNLYAGAMGASTVAPSIIEDERHTYEAETAWWHVMIEAVLWER